MLGAIAVKHIAMPANIKPPTKASGIIIGNNGLKGKPRATIATNTTANTTEAFMVARVAPQTISPAITSSTLTGVAIMASKVF